MSEFRVEKATYIESLSEHDRESLGILATAFLEYLDKKGIAGALVIVGGSVNPETRGSSRKDIDIVPLVKGVDDFEGFKNMVDFIRLTAGFEEKKVIEPIMDEEFNSPAILRHDGAIALGYGNSTPMEFIPRYLCNLTIEEAIKKVQTRNTKYYCELIRSE